MTYPIHSGSPFPGSRNWVSCQTQSLLLDNAAQCRRLTDGSSIAATVWTHEGTYLIYGFLAMNPSWIWIRYIQHATHRHNFMSPPKLAMSIRRTIHLWATLMETTHTLLKYQTHETHGDSKVHFLQRQHGFR